MSGWTDIRVPQASGRHLAGQRTLAVRNAGGKKGRATGAIEHAMTEIFKTAGHLRGMLAAPATPTERRPVKTDSLRINELPTEAYAWYEDYLGVLDAKDIDSYADFLDPEVELILNNAEPVTGRDAVVAGLGEYWKSFGTLEHEPLAILGTPSNFVLEALNHYTTLDGRQVTLRAVAFTDRDQDGLVTSVRLYTDTTPLFEATD